MEVFKGLGISAAALDEGVFRAYWDAIKAFFVNGPENWYAKDDRNQTYGDDPNMDGLKILNHLCVYMWLHRKTSIPLRTTSGVASLFELNTQCHEPCHRVFVRWYKCCSNLFVYSAQPTTKEADRHDGTSQ